MPGLRESMLLPWTPLGRRRIRMGLRARAWPLTYPLAFAYRRTAIRSAHVIAITGSFGKTTTTRAVAAVLGQPQAHLEWGLNARGFLAESLFRTRPGRSAAIEVGIWRKGRMKTYARLLRPDRAVVTSIGGEHHVRLGSIGEIRSEKAEILRRLPCDGVAILNGDDPNVRWMAGQTRASVLTFGFGEANDVRARAYRSEGLEGGRFLVRADGRSREVRTRLVGRHQVGALLAAIAVARTENVDLDKALAALENLAPTPQRLFPVRFPSGAGLLLDDYKTVLETVHASLATLSEVAASRKIVVLGTIYEPPGPEVEIYASLGQPVADVADEVIFVGSEPAYDGLRAGIGAGGPSVRFARDGALEAAAMLREVLTPESVALLKGLGTQRFERIPLLLSGESVSCRRVTCKASLTWRCATCPYLHLRRE